MRPSPILLRSSERPLNAPARAQPSIGGDLRKPPKSLAKDTRPTSRRQRASGRGSSRRAGREPARGERVTCLAETTQEAADAVHLIRPGRISSTAAVHLIRHRRIFRTAAVHAIRHRRISSTDALHAIRPTRISGRGAVHAIRPPRISRTDAVHAIRPPRISGTDAVHAIRPSRISSTDAVHAIRPSRISSTDALASSRGPAGPLGRALPPPVAAVNETVFTPPAGTADRSSRS